MSTTYAAILKGNQLDWMGEKPANLPADRAVQVQVTIPDEPRADASAAAQGERRADALAKLAALGGIRSIPDPAAWQREQREDRTLPGRDK